MSTTDDLRRMLDERGVKWEDDTPVPSMKPWKTSFTSFTGEEVSLGCYDEPKWIMGTLVFRTPEQAIAATLGESAGRTCRNVSDPPEGFLCSECGWGDFAEPSHLLTGACYAGLAKGPRYCPNCGARVVS